MFRGIKAITGAVLALAILAGPAIATSSVDLSNPAFAPVTGTTSVPIGAAEFCKTHRSDCGANAGPQIEPLTDATWRRLIAVNDAVNSSVAPVTDKDLYNVNEFWTYPAGR